jgi:hypothetical protein
MTSDEPETNGAKPKLQQTSQELSATPLELVKLDVISEDAQSGLTASDRPVLFGPLWKEITIVLLLCCGPATQVLNTGKGS